MTTTRRFTADYKRKILAEADEWPAPARVSFVRGGARTVHALLAEHPDVEHWRLAGQGEGSWGDDCPAARER